MSLARDRKLPYKGRDKYPCYIDGVDCPERHIGCHDHCQHWLDAKAANDARKAGENEKRKSEHMVNGFFAAQSCAVQHKKPAQR